MKHKSHHSILLVEDENDLGETLSEYLIAKDFNVRWARTVSEAEDIFARDSQLSIVLMDIGLPDGDGLTLAKSFQMKRPELLLIFLSAQNDPTLKLQALEDGAYDYITKPFHLKELILRLERLLEFQSTVQDLPDEIRVGKLKIWFKKYMVENAQGDILNLSHKECAILEYLFKNKDQVIPRDKILDQVWGSETYPTNRTVDNYIVKLRKWCDTDPSSKLQIISQRGVGYKLVIKE